MGKANPGIQKILIYGSRARGTHRKGSDVDLAIVGELEGTALWRIRDLLNEIMSTIYFYDVVHLDTLAEGDFKNQILKEGQTIFHKAQWDKKTITALVEENPGKYLGNTQDHKTALHHFLQGFTTANNFLHLFHTETTTQPPKPKTTK